jgi:membrane protein DedA with SNARE-associated domain
MLEGLLIWLQGIAVAHGPLGVFLIAFLQEIVPPIPSTLVSAGSGLLIVGDASVTTASVVKLVTHVGLPIAFGMTLGALIVYGVVYWGGAPLVKRFGHLVGISWDDIEKFRMRMRGTAADEVIFFAARAFPLTPSILLNIVCGVLRWNPVSFIISTFFGTLIRATWSGFLGWQLGNALVSYSNHIEQAHNIFFAVFVIALIAFFGYRKWKSKQPTANSPQQGVLH